MTTHTHNHGYTWSYSCVQWLSAILKLERNKAASLTTVAISAGKIRVHEPLKVLGCQGLTQWNGIHSSLDYSHVSTDESLRGTRVKWPLCWVRHRFIPSIFWGNSPFLFQGLSHPRESFRETVNYSRVFFHSQLQRECSNFSVKMVAFARTKGETVLHWEGSSFQLWQNRSDCTTRFLRKSVWTVVWDALHIDSHLLEQLAF